MRTQKHTNDARPSADDARPLTRAASEQVRVDSYSVEQDELHQFVDCAVLGPYGAADLHAGFRTIGDAAFAVPQYHRGAPDSRAFEAGRATGGSELRRSAMAAVQAAASAFARNGVVENTLDVMRAVRGTFRDPDNLRCQCPGEAARSIACCARHGWTSAADVTFPANAALAEQWDMTAGVLGSTLQHIIDERLLSRDIWTEPEYSFAPAQAATEVRCARAGLRSTCACVLACASARLAPARAVR